MSGASFRDAAVLVVGGAGFVGSNLCRLLLAEGVRYLSVVDNLLSSERDNLPGDPRVELRIGSIADPAVLATIEDEFDYVFHLATFHGNQSSIHDPLEDHANNTITSLRLFHHLRGAKLLKKLVYSGAGCAVAAKDVTEGAEATREDAPICLEMDSPYSISKIVGEMYAVYFHRQSGLPAVRARFQNVYGPGEVLGAGRWRGTSATVWRNVTPTFVFKALRKEALPLENEGAGSRDFIFVDDICRGLMACALRGRPGEVYNLASGAETTIRTLAETVNRLAENPTPCTLKPRRAWDHSIRRFGSGEKARSELGFVATVPLEDGLRRTIDWTRGALPRIARCMDRHRERMAQAGSPLP